MPYKSYYSSEEGEFRQNLDENETRAAFESHQGLLWVDISDTTPEDGDFLSRVFGFHPLAVEDCVDPAVHNAKVENFDEYLFITLRGVDYTIESHLVHTTELNIFLGSNFVVTNHNTFLYSVDSISRQVEIDGRPMRRGAEFFAYEIMDAVVDNFLPVIERLNERADEIEDEIFAAAEESMLADVTSLKRSSLRLRRALMPQREVFNLLSRHEMDSLSEEAQRYYRDIYDNVVRMETMAEVLRERADTALTMYLSVVANRQNETMKVLSMVAAIFLPLSLLAGIYGMNFENMPELHVSWAYFAVVGFIVTTIVVTLWLFWLGRWFRIGRRRLKRFVPTAVDPERLARYVNQRTPWR